MKKNIIKEKININGQIIDSYYISYYHNGEITKNDILKKCEKFTLLLFKETDNLINRLVGYKKKTTFYFIKK